MENEWNRGKIYKFTGGHKWIEANVENLEVGDIIKLNSKQLCPADILLLDSSDLRMNEKIALVNERKISGQQKMIRKFPINDKIITEDNLQKDIKNIMNGTVEYKRPGIYSSEPIGTFKIKGDPKVRNIVQDNLIYAGSKIYSKS